MASFKGMPEQLVVEPARMATPACGGSDHNAVHIHKTRIAQAEPDRIEKVIENLVINAVEAMGSRGGILSIQAGRTPDDKAYFKISDGGKGMTEEFVRTRLFRAFSTTKRDGIGLGLYTSREIVKAHGGTIEVESAPNSGTTFCVVLPSATKT